MNKSIEDLEHELNEMHVKYTSILKNKAIELKGEDIFRDIEEALNRLDEMDKKVRSINSELGEKQNEILFSIVDPDDMGKVKSSLELVGDGIMVEAYLILEKYFKKNNLKLGKKIKKHWKDNDCWLLKEEGGEDTYFIKDSMGLDFYKEELKLTVEDRIGNLENKKEPMIKVLFAFSLVLLMVFGFFSFYLLGEIRALREERRSVKRDIDSLRIMILGEEEDKKIGLKDKIETLEGEFKENEASEIEEKTLYGKVEELIKVVLGEKANLEKGSVPGLVQKIKKVEELFGKDGLEKKFALKKIVDNFLKTLEGLEKKYQELNTSLNKEKGVNEDQGKKLDRIDATVSSFKVPDKSEIVEELKRYSKEQLVSKFEEFTNLEDRMQNLEEDYGDDFSELKRNQDEFKKKYAIAFNSLVDVIKGIEPKISGLSRKTMDDIKKLEKVEEE